MDVLGGTATEDNQDMGCILRKSRSALNTETGQQT